MIVLFGFSGLTKYNHQMERYVLVKDSLSYSVCKEEYSLDEEEIRIISENEELSFIIDGLFEHNKKLCTTHKTIGEFKDLFETTISSATNSNIREYFKKETYVSKIVEEFVNKTSDIYKNNTLGYKLYYEESNNKDIINDVYLQFTILKSTIQEINKNLKLESNDKKKIAQYNTFLKEIIYKWEELAFGKNMPNSISISIGNLFEYFEVRNHILLEFYSSFMTSFDMFGKWKNNIILVWTLTNLFEDNTLNKKRHTSIKSLCTAIMHKNTFNKYYSKLENYYCQLN